MATLLEILELIEVEDASIRKDAEMMANKMASNLIKPWKLSPDVLPKSIKFKLEISGYRIFDSMDYSNMKELPENPHFDFDPSGNDFERYFGITSLERKIEVPHQTKGNLVTIGLGKSLIENSAYIVIASDAARMPGRIKAVKGNEQVIEPILYALIRGHIEILIPNNLVYSR